MESSLPTPFCKGLCQPPGRIDSTFYWGIVAITALSCWVFVKSHGFCSIGKRF